MLHVSASYFKIEMLINTTLTLQACLLSLFFIFIFKVHCRYEQKQIEFDFGLDMHPKEIFTTKSLSTYDGSDVSLG